MRPRIWPATGPGSVCQPTHNPHEGTHYMCLSFRLTKTVPGSFLVATPLHSDSRHLTLSLLSKEVCIAIITFTPQSGGIQLGVCKVERLQCRGNGESADERHGFFQPGKLCGEGPISETRMTGRGVTSNLPEEMKGTARQASPAIKLVDANRGRLPILSTSR